MIMNLLDVLYVVDIKKAMEYSCTTIQANWIIIQSGLTLTSRLVIGRIHETKLLRAAVGNDSCATNKSFKRCFV